MTPSISPRFQSVLEHLQEALRGLRTGRASVGLVEGLLIDYYGTQTRLKDIAALSTPDPRTIQIEPWDIHAVPAIEKAITTSSLGMAPNTAGKVIRLAVPVLTEERRKELVKFMGKTVEEARITIRTIREKSLHELKRKEEAGDISKDIHMREKSQLQKEVDEAGEECTRLASEKEQEILGAA